jgi:hypothetical protein
MRSLVSIALLAACGPSIGENAGTDVDAGVTDPDACVGLRCQVVNCAAQSAPPTTLSGTVYAPNGTLPLYGAIVYVPNADPGPLPMGLSCDQCGAPLAGDPIVQTKTDVAGRFTLTDLPAGSDIPVVVQIGKWRRQIVVPGVPACTETALPPALTSLPRNKQEGDLPQIAITTGSADALECLVRKLGVDDAEITSSAGNGKVHLFEGNGARRFAGGFPGGAGDFPNATTLWNDANALRGYDLVILSCEGGQRPGTKSQAAMDAVKEYADAGGRVFMSHWHNIWIEGARSGGSQKPAVWTEVATWGGNGSFNGNDTIDEINNPKGVAFADWMLEVGGSTTRGLIPITGGRQTVQSVDETRGDRWVYRASGGNEFPQNFQFTTPNEMPENQRCGKVAFSDMHVSSGSSSSSGTAYPGGCSSAPLTPQEKALVFMLFDIASCVDAPIL